MPRFTPFPALRYCDADIDDLIAPPYDVLSEADLDELGARSPWNITHVDVPRESAGPRRYDTAAATLREWIDAGVMSYDDTPTFTIYRMRFTDASGTERDIAGVLGGLEVVDEGAGGVLPHERVTPKASTDRLDLTRATSIEAAEGSAWEYFQEVRRFARGHVPDAYRGLPGGFARLRSPTAEGLKYHGTATGQVFRNG